MWYKIAVALVVVQGIHAGNDMNSVESQYGHELQWYSTKQACDLLRNYRTIHVVGDSTSRRLAYTLRALLVGWPEASLRSDDRYGDRGGQDSWAKLNRTLGTVLARLSQVLPDRVKGKKWLPSARQRASAQLPLAVLRPDQGGQPGACIADAVVSHMAPTFETLNVCVVNLLETVGQNDIVVFSVGSWDMLHDELNTKASASSFEATLDAIASKHAPGSVWLWRTPGAVDPDHSRWAGKAVRAEVSTFTKYSMAAAAKRGLPSANSSAVTLSTSEPNWEAGKEWVPPQHGGIHLLDSGRRELAQIVLNALGKLSANSPQ